MFTITVTKDAQVVYLLSESTIWKLLTTPTEYAGLKSSCLSSERKYNLKATHNLRIRRSPAQLVVYLLSESTIWKLLTTPDLKVPAARALFIFWAKVQFESYSQLPGHHGGNECVVYLLSESTIWKLLTTAGPLRSRPLLVVYLLSESTIWKLLTTVFSQIVICVAVCLAPPTGPGSCARAIVFRENMCSAWFFWFFFSSRKKEQTEFNDLSARTLFHARVGVARQLRLMLSCAIYEAEKWNYSDLVGETPTRGNKPNSMI